MKNKLPSVIVALAICAQVPLLSLAIFHAHSLDVAKEDIESWLRYSVFALAVVVSGALAYIGHSLALLERVTWKVRALFYGLMFSFSFFLLFYLLHAYTGKQVEDILTLAWISEHFMLIAYFGTVPLLPDLASITVLIVHSLRKAEGGMMAQLRQEGEEHERIILDLRRQVATLEASEGLQATRVLSDVVLSTLRTSGRWYGTPELVSRLGIDPGQSGTVLSVLGSLASSGAVCSLTTDAGKVWAVVPPPAYPSLDPQV